VHPEDREEIVGNWQRTTSVGAVLDAPYRVIRASGEVIHVRVRAQSVRLPGGSHGGYIGSVVDVTAKVVNPLFPEFWNEDGGYVKPPITDFSEWAEEHTVSSSDGG
jgi:hypothetical protein